MKCAIQTPGAFGARSGRPHTGRMPPRAAPGARRAAARAEPLESRVLLAAVAGHRDATFGTDGVLRADFGGAAEAARAVAVLADGKFLVAGTSEASDATAPDVPAFRRITLARYLP